MTTAVQRLDDSSSRRLQATLVFVTLAGAAALTALLVVTAPSSKAESNPADPIAIPQGVTVEVRGGEPFVAYTIADRLSGRGAHLGAVSPESDPNSVVSETTILYYDRRQMEAAATIRRIVGRGTLRHEHVFEPVVDVTIVLGKDLKSA